MKSAIAAAHSTNASAVSMGLAKEASLRLLQRSIGFGHGRLSVIRLVMAVQAGAEIPDECWDFCRSISLTTKDSKIRSLYFEALGNTEYPAPRTILDSTKLAQ